MAPDHVKGAALELTKRLYEATFYRQRITEGLWRYLDPIQQAFLQAARDDLQSDCPVSRPAVPPDLDRTPLADWHCGRFGRT